MKACLAEAIDNTMAVKTTEVEVGSIILAPGFQPFDPTPYEVYSYATHPNVVTSLEFERILSASALIRDTLYVHQITRNPKKSPGSNVSDREISISVTIPIAPRCAAPTA